MMICISKRVVLTHVVIVFLLTIFGQCMDFGIAHGGRFLFDAKIAGIGRIQFN